MSKESPKFVSNLPEHLLANASPESKWIMENMSILIQKTDYVLEDQAKHGEKLDVLDERLVYTNSKIATAMKDIANLQEKSKIFDDIKDDLKEIVNTKRFIGKIAGSKWSWVVGGVLVIGVIQILNNPVLREWLLKLV